MDDKKFNNREQSFFSPDKYVKLRPIILKKNKRRKNEDRNIMSLMKYITNTPHKNIKIINTENEFSEYTEMLDNSLSKYHLKYDKKKKDEDDENEEERKNINKYFNKENIRCIKRIYSSNKSHEKNVKSKEAAIKIGINDMAYPNPFKSLGIINKNHVIYDDINKKILARQSDSFNKQIEEIQQYNMKFGTKMPKINIIDLSLKNSLNIPTNLANKKNFLPTLKNKGKKDLKLFGYYKYPNKNFPEGREQFSICIKNGEILISGGITSNKQFMTIWSLNIPKLEWLKISQKDSIDNRYGHTAIAINNKLFIFGGITKYENSSITNGLIIFSFNDYKYSIPELGHIKPEPRRSHIAVLLSNQILIHGGINEENKILNDCYILNINPMKWFQPKIDNSCKFPKLYGHAACLVIPIMILITHKFNIYSFSEGNINNKKINQIKIKGLYIFGGKNKEFGGISNQLWILIMGKKPLEWIIPVTKGKPPSPRFFHTMNYYEKGNYLIVHGGRNDCISDDSALNDTYLFNLENLEWVNVEIFSNNNDFKVLSRYGHQSIIFSDKLMILGGMNNNNYLGSALLIFNLDFSYSGEIKSNEDIDINKEENRSSSYKKNEAISQLKMKPSGINNDVELPSIK